MKALDTPNPRDIAVHEAQLDADGWFTALDDRVIQVGTDRCVVQVQGIHSDASGLWIQLTCGDDQELNLVLCVNTGTRLEDVLERLELRPPCGQPLEVVKFAGPATGRDHRLYDRPVPRHELAH